MGRFFPYPSGRRMSGEQELRFRVSLLAAAEWMSDEQVMALAEALHEALRSRGERSLSGRLDTRV